MAEKIKIALSGANGRMGKYAGDFFSKDPEIEISYGIDINTIPRPKGEFQIYPTSEIYNLPLVDIWLDFSKPPSAVKENIPKVVERKIKPIIATTGFSEEERKYLIGVINEARIPCVWASNFSTGIAVMRYLAKEATRLLGSEYDIETLERHHRMKADGESGTLRDINRDIVSVRSELTPVYREPGQHPRKPEELGTSYQRAGKDGNPGFHQVIFGGNQEEVGVHHQAFSPIVFINGARRAIKWLYKKDKPGIYTMNNVLGI
jgi:4-hydroxy-tetrahydrodipicolinate reductase